MFNWANWPVNFGFFVVLELLALSLLFSWDNGISSEEPDEATDWVCCDLAFTDHCMFSATIFDVFSLSFSFIFSDISLLFFTLLTTFGGLNLPSTCFFTGERCFLYFNFNFAAWILFGDDSSCFLGTISLEKLDTTLRISLRFKAARPPISNKKHS